MPDAAQIALALAKDYEAVFTTEPGVRVLADLHVQGFMERPLVEMNSPASVDVFRLGIAEGRRSLVLYMRHRIAQAKQPPAAQQTALTGPKEVTEDHG